MANNRKVQFFSGMILLFVVFCTKTESVGLNETCTDNSSCTESVNNSVCDTADGTGLCVCDTGYEETSGECSGITCTSASLPTVSYSTKSPDYTSYNYSAEVTFTCDTGYAKTAGDDKVQCTAIDSWTGTYPTCTRITCTSASLPTVSYFTKSPDYTSYNYSAEVTFTCDTGYAKTAGDDKVQCTAIDSWTGTYPTCTRITCTSASLPTVSYSTKSPDYTSYNYSAEVTFTCDTGYAKTAGDDKVQCTAIDTWTGTYPTCTRITCPASRLETVLHSTKSPELTSYNYSAEVTFTCDTGYAKTAGDDKVQCTAIDSWTGTYPTCTRITCTAASLETVLHSTKLPALTSYNYSAEVTFTCDTGYVKTAGDNKVQCTAIDSWTGTYPTCTRITCTAASLETVLHSTKSPELTSYNFSAEVTFTCDIGYAKTAGDDKVQCTAIDSWSGTYPTCTRITCTASSLPTVLHSTKTPALTSYNYSAEVTITCDTGYAKTAGDDKVKCTAIDSWAGTYPTCTRITCTASSLPTVLHSTKSPELTSYNYSAEVTFTCDIRYAKTAGDDKVQCTAIDSWSGTYPTCTRITCTASSLETVLHSTKSPALTSYDYSAEVTFTCDTGYAKTAGDDKVQCTSINTWAGTYPTCTRITCTASSLPTVSYSTKSPEQTSYDYSAEVSFSCVTGYEKTAGDDKVQCTSINMWTGTYPTCTRITCTASSLPTVSYSTKSPEQTSYDYSAEVSFSCVTGYEKTTGDDKVQCTAINMWTGTYPTCTIKKCIPEDVPNSLPVLSDYEYNTTVNYTCDSGYSHTAGDLIRRCLADKTWSGTRPTCAKIQLGDTGCVNSPANSCEDSNAECRASDTKCVCRSDFYDDNGADTMQGTCKPKLGLGRNCSTTVNDSCSDPNAICKTDTKTCKCVSEYYDSNGEETVNGICVARRNLSAACEAGDTTNDQCKDLNAECTIKNGDYRCTCNTGYHTEGLACIADKPLGGTCTQGEPGQCSDPNADCLASGSQLYSCTCKTGFYDDNGFDADGNCQNMGNLMVTGIQFNNINTASFTVSWTEPSSYKSHISRYSVHWSPGSAAELNVSKTTAEVTGLPTPGAVYTVYVTTYNDVTQVNSPRTVSVHKQQASKPDVPGPLELDRSDLDASKGSISLAWTASDGEVSKYIVAIFDGNMELTKDAGADHSTVIGFSDIKNGYRYNVSITAYSLQYDNNKTEESLPYVQEIKTVVQIPSEPRNFSCEERKDVFISLSWEDPLFPNGDLIEYIIDVYLKEIPDIVNKTVMTVTPGNQYKIMSLEPGTYYTFEIFTVNENFTSSSKAITTCKTQDKASDPPNDFAVAEVTNRSMTVAWKKPTESYGQILAYVLQLRNEQNICRKEIFLNCTDCTGKIPTDLQRMCSAQRETKQVSSEELEKDQEVKVSDLQPYFTYEVTVSVVNEAGKGYEANLTQQTLEEVPETPANVAVESITKNSFIVKWTKGSVRPGITHYIVSIKTSMEQLEKTISVEGYNTESAVIEHLEEYWEYSVQVTASTSVGSAESSIVENIRTLAAAPGPVADFKITTGNDAGGSYQTLIVQWKIPDILRRNSDITGYMFVYNDTTENVQSKHLNATSEELKETISVVPERYYTIKVYAINHQNENGEETILTKQAPAGVPENTFEEQGNVVIEAKEVNEIGQATIKLPINLAYFDQSANGKVIEDGVVVYAKTKRQLEAEGSTSVSLNKFQTMDNWKTASKQGYTMYRATHQQWLVELQKGTRKRRAAAGTDNQVNWELGSEDCSAVSDKVFCNGPLAADTDYIVRLVVCTNGGCLLSKEYGPFHTQAIPPESNPAPIIGGAVGGVVAAVAVIAVVGFIIYRRRSADKKPKKPCKPMTPTELHPEIERYRTVALKDFPAHLDRLHKDSNLLFSAEYEDLRTLSPAHPTTAADEEENRLKNRYINILPFDHTRVKLLQQTDDDSDFINANYLPGYRSPREYIGCQGPIPATLDDFWQMVWEQNVGVIVILTLCKEGNKVKCEQYWPDEIGEPKQYGDIVVEVTSLSNIKFYDYRIFKLSYANTTRTVKHFHFLSWLDFQANITHDTILDFIKQVRSHVQPPDTAGPMIVHCSAGVGRTGTYICLDYLQQFLDEHDFSAEVDIFDMVLKLRENRPHMVQTEQQYVFIHDCLNEMIERKRKALEEGDNIYVNQGFNQDENLYQNTESLYQNVSVSGKGMQNTEL